MKSFLLRLGAQIKWRVERDGDGWLGVCDDLRLTVSGDTYSELTEIIHEALDCLFKDLIITGDLVPYLKEMGWREKYIVPKISQEELEQVMIDVPVDIVGGPRYASC